MSVKSAIAMNRFGLGIKPGRVLPSKPEGWLLDQFSKFNPRPSELASQPNRQAISSAFKDYQAAAKIERQARKMESPQSDGVEKGPPSNTRPGGMAQADKQQERKAIRDIYVGAANARLSSATASDTDFAERLVHFWSNHFAVSVDKLPVLALAGDYEFTAIRPNIMGKFTDLLFAVTQHPAMVLFLDQATSIGPTSPLAQRIAQRRNKEFGLNENLAREILELHTLGVRTGYSQSDVTEFARALTGRTVAGLGGGPFQRQLEGRMQAGDSIFFEAIHEPGKRLIMGRTYAEGGEVQASAILSDLATHPATAKHIAAKLAVHFVSDTPPPALVRKLEENFLKTGGDLPSLYRTLVEAAEAWTPSLSASTAKFKSPWEWMVSALRALNASDLPGGSRAVPVLEQLGQPIWKPGSPAGFADSNATWAGSAALMRRVEIAARLAQRSAAQVDARALAPQILPGTLSSLTAEGISRAESPAQALSLLLVSPEFLRR
jgi:uncharacterized protein (DUF1800 family)